MTDALIRFAHKHERAIGLLGAAWFALGCAGQAGFVDLPRFPFLTGPVALVAAGLFNAAWFGFARPAIEKRKAALRAEDSPP